MVVKDMGFGCLLECRTRSLRKGMWIWMMEHFDPTILSIQVDGKPTFITVKHVEYLLGFKDSGFSIKEMDPT